MTTSITGIGVYLPETTRSNDFWPPAFHERFGAHGDRTFNDIPSPLDEQAAAIVARDLALEACDPMLGARLRHVADASLSSAQAEAFAALVALRDAGISADNVDLVLSHALVPDRLMPPTATALAHLIGAHQARALAVDSACASALSQLEVAHAFIEAGLARHVLLAQSHLLWRALSPNHPASPGLGDAASALVVSKSSSSASTGPGLTLRATCGQTHGEHALSVTWLRGTDADSDPDWWRAGGDMRMGSRNPEGAKFLMRETVTFGARTIHECALRAGIPVDRIGVLASVQPRGFIPHAIAERLGLPRERAVTSYEEIAHVGACGPIFNLHKARREGRLRAGTVVALYAQGAGFTRAAALLEM
jgi:3-oxoacyl-[acyl-carrier-protein] synthase-3